MFPNVNYIGNKRKLSEWIMNLIPDDVETVTDAFAGGCSVSYEFKSNGYSLVSNDSLYSSFVISKSLIENNGTLLDVNNIVNAEGYDISKKQIDKYNWLSNYLYFPNEIEELAKLVEYSEKKLNGYEYYMYLSLLRRAMIRKLPYSRMNINWKNIVKLRDEDYSYEKYGRRRAYHNKSFGFHMLDSANDYNMSVFNSSKSIKSEQMDVLQLLTKYPKRDLLYLDPPYPGTMNDYDGFYGAFDKIFNRNKSHIDLTNKNTFISFMEKIIQKSVNYKYVVISFNNSIKPNPDELIDLFSNYGSVKIHSMKHNYQVSGSKLKNQNVEKLAIIKMD